MFDFRVNTPVFNVFSSFDELFYQKQPRLPLG